MMRFEWQRGAASRSLALVTLVALSGCNDGTPSVATSTAEATVTGSVVYKGKPVNEGQIRFNPANVKRRNAPIVAAPITDGKYSVKTMVGENSITFDLPTIGKKDGSIAFSTFYFDVPSSGGTFDISLPK